MVCVQEANCNNFYLCDYQYVEIMQEADCNETNNEKDTLILQKGLKGHLMLAAPITVLIRLENIGRNMAYY